MKWITTLHCNRLTEEQAREELAHLLRGCEDEETFRKECRHRFGGPMVDLTWGDAARSANICFNQLDKGTMTVFAHVTVNAPEMGADDINESEEEVFFQVERDYNQIDAWNE